MRRTLTNMLTPYMQEFNEVWDRTLYSSAIGAGLSTPCRPLIDFISGEPVSSPAVVSTPCCPVKFNYKEQDIL